MKIYRKGNNLRANSFRLVRYNEIFEVLILHYSANPTILKTHIQTPPYKFYHIYQIRWK